MVPQQGLTCTDYWELAKVPVGVTKEQMEHYSALVRSPLYRSPARERAWRWANWGRPGRGVSAGRGRRAASAQNAYQVITDAKAKLAELEPGGPAVPGASVKDPAYDRSDLIRSVDQQLTAHAD